MQQVANEAPGRRLMLVQVDGWWLCAHLLHLFAVFANKWSDKVKCIYGEQHLIIELGNSQSATAIRLNGHSNNDNYAQGKTGFKITDGEEHKVILKKKKVV